MKDSTIILLNMLLMIVVYIIEKYNGDTRLELFYSAMSLQCTYWIVRAIENK